MSDNQKDVGGVIFGLRENNFELLKSRKNPVYVKFTAHHPSSRSPNRVQSGHLLLFYISGKCKAVAGYSKILDVSYNEPVEILENYLNHIQMTKHEYEVYIDSRESKPILTLKLGEIITLKKGIKLDFPITMAGKLVSSDEISNIIGLDDF